MADTLCVRAQFTLTGPTSVTTNFPTAAECPSGLVLTRSQPATWVQTPNRRLRLLVRLRNLTGQAVQLPVRLYLPATGTTVVLPAGTPPSKVVAYQPDSSEAGGGRVWFIGGSSVLAAGDSTAEDTLTFQVQSPVTKARWQFQATASAVAGGGPVPALPPDSIPSWVLADSSIDGNGYTKRLLEVLFLASAPQAERQSALQSVGGTVVGGLPMSDGDGYYLVQLPDDGSGALLDSAVVQLMLLPAVQHAARQWRGTGPTYLRPDDGVNWQRQDWRLPLDSALGDNWALEDVAAPFAWGCSTGDTSAHVAVLDHAFQPTEVASNVSVGSSVLGRYPADPRLHGTIVSNILAARGNDSSGMTGIMWRAGLHLQDFGTSHPTPSQIGREIERAGAAGVSIVNLSYGWDIPWGPYVPTGAAQDTAFVWRQLAPMMRYLRKSQQSGKLPLVVVSAGNYPVDALLIGYPALKDSFPSNFLVVGASTKAPRGRWISVGTGQASAVGPRVDIYAPGEGVFTYGPGGYGPGSGTSEAAPIVAGIAGLLKSFNPNLTAAELRDLVINGAVVGGRNVVRTPGTSDSAPLANAYESLRLAAQRPGAPVCGNRMWRRGLNVVVRRTPTVTDTFRWTAPDTVIALLAPHGGKYLGARNAKGWLFQGGQWVFTQAPTFTASGVENSRFGFSHDADSSGYEHGNGATTEAVRYTQPTPLAVFQGYPASWQTAPTCNCLAYAGWDGIGNQLLVAVHPTVLDSAADVYAVKIGTGASRKLFTLPKAFYVLKTVSEDGAEVAVSYNTVSQFANPPQIPLSGPCYTEFRSMATGQLLEGPYQTECDLGSGSVAAGALARWEAIAEAYGVPLAWSAGAPASAPLRGPMRPGQAP
ncbi:MAG: S8 family serine peptidase [Gemmatimonadetes bacterium]|nr:S8 family serine peptidase [Gemmatimonadota bacterium]